MSSLIRVAVMCLGTASVLVSAAFAGDWPAFRGPTGNGLSPESSAPLNWSAEKNVKWKSKLPGPGNGSPIVSNGRVFVLCAEDKGKKRNLYCLDRATGVQQWVRTAAFAQEMPTHQTNPYCGSTPAADGQRVVVFHGSAGLFCYDFAGQELWQRDLGEFRHIWGYGTSPVIVGERVFLHSGPGKRVFVGAYELATGKTVWETDEPVPGNQAREDGKYLGSWTTPVVATIGGKQQLLCTLPKRIVGLDPANGSVLWWCEGVRGPRGDLAYSSPVVCGDVCVTVGGFKGPAIGFPLGGQGNLTDARLWRIEENPQSIGSGVFYGGHLYRPNAGPGTIECIEPATGKVLWSDRAKGGEYWGSMVLAAGRIYVTNQAGTTIVFRPNPEKFELLAANDLGEPSNSTPAFSDGQIFLRTFGNVYCIAE